MRLHLIRHGIAIDRDDPDCPAEAERYLTEEGIRKTRAVAKGIRRLEIKGSLVMSSPYLRARQTAQIVCEALAVPQTRIILTEALLPEADPLELFEQLSKSKEAEVMCFGHAPHVDAAVAVAVGASRDLTAMKKSGLAVLDLWSLQPPQGTLSLLLTPKVLRRLGGEKD